MFEKLKAMFGRKKAEQPTKKQQRASFVPPPPPPPRGDYSRPLSPASKPLASAAPTTEAKRDDGDFATSYVVGMATNNALMGYAVGGNFLGGVAGDIARDGSIGEAHRSYDSGSSCSSSSSSSYDSGSSSSYDSGSSSSSSCDSGSSW